MNDSVKLIIFVIYLVLVIGCFVPFTDAINGLSTGSWSFSGSDMVIAFLPYVPVIYIALAVMVPIYWLKEHE